MTVTSPMSIPMPSQSAVTMNPNHLHLHRKRAFGLSLNLAFKAPLYDVLPLIVSTPLLPVPAPQGLAHLTFLALSPAPSILTFMLPVMMSDRLGPFKLCICCLCLTNFAMHRPLSTIFVLNCLIPNVNVVMLNVELIVQRCSLTWRKGCRTHCKNGKIGVFGWKLFIEVGEGQLFGLILKMTISTTMIPT
jgi:hypothetical protein